MQANDCMSRAGICLPFFTGTTRGVGAQLLLPKFVSTGRHCGSGTRGNKNGTNLVTAL